MGASGLLVMGLDCGGSKTTALLSNHPGAIISIGTGGPANFQTGGIDAARQSIDQAVADAFDRAGLPPGPLAGLCLGLAGVSRPGDEGWALEWAAARGWAGRVKIVNDTELLLWAGTPDGWGVAVVSGTGSMVFGRSHGGRAARAGGWGPLLGDEGSGYAIGQAALRAVTRAADGRAQPTALTGLVLERLRLENPTQLVAAAYQDGLSRSEISSLTELVAIAAAQGDPASQQIEADAADELALAFAAVTGQLELTGQVPCALGGGVLVHNPRLAERVISSARRPAAWPEPIQLVTRPAEGALRLAWQEVLPA